MSDVPFWNTVDRPVLEAVALLSSQGEVPDDQRLASVLPSTLSATEVRQALMRLIGQGLLLGDRVDFAERAAPIRVVNLVPTSAGLKALTA